MMNYTKAQEKALDDYLTVCIKNNHHCQHCAKNDNGICYFAFQCFANDMMHFDDEEDALDIPDDVDEFNYNPYMGCDDYDYESDIDLDGWSDY